MKKIMTIMAVAAVATAFGATDCSRATPTPAAVAVQGGVYQIKMQLKTTKGVTVAGTSKTITTGGVCNRTSTTNTTAGCVYRTTDSITIDGWIVECTNTCKVIENSKVTYVWDSKRKTQIQAGKFSWDFINIMGKTDTEAEAYGTFASGVLQYNSKQIQKFPLLTLAGQGKFDKAKKYYTSLAGNAAGYMEASYDLNPPANADASLACAASKVWDCGTYDAASTVCTKGSAKKTAVYGTWSIKYNSAASNKYFKQGILDLPAYVK